MMLGWWMCQTTCFIIPQNKFPNMNNLPCIIKAGELKECSACIKQNDSSLSTG